LGLAVGLNLEVEQLDIKITFLHEEIKEEIYMEHPKSYEEPNKEHLVCRLKKSLYGLKQTSKQWYKKFESFMTKHSFNKTIGDHCVFIKRYEDGKYIILLLYVDDMLIIGQNKTKIVCLMNTLSKSFAMKDLGPAKQILGMKVIRDRSKKLVDIAITREVH